MNGRGKRSRNDKTVEAMKWKIGSIDGVRDDVG